MINKVQKAGELRERLVRNKAARVQRLKAKREGSFQEVHQKSMLYLSFPNRQDFASKDLGISCFWMILYYFVLGL